jgi:hypothetical protein
MPPCPSGSTLGFQRRPSRAGPGAVDVLLRVYANCIDGDDEIANRRFGGVLA